jgi:NHLM bacteriocin system ABC transporter peptidase/ATP-binding protein
MKLWSELKQFWISQIAKHNGSWIRTPTVLQMENTECGAAALSIILQHYGKYLPLAQLREQCGVSRDGSDAANIILAANQLGLKGRGFKKGLVKLKKVNLPVILFWEFNHFLILEGFVGNRVMLNDPALGPRSVSEEEFDMSYTGITLVFERTNEFICDGEAPKIWPIVLRRMLSERFAIVFTLLTGLLLIIPQLVMPVFAQIYIDEVLGNQLEQWLKPMLWAMALTIIFQAVVQQLQLFSTRALEKRLTRRFAAQFERKVLSLPEQFYAQRYAGDIALRVQYNNEVSEFIASRLIPLVSGIVLLSFYLILTLLYSPYLGLIVLITTGINAIVVGLNLRFLKDSSLQISKDGAKVGAVVIGAVRDIESVKSAAIEGDIFKKFSGYQTRLLNFSQEIGMRNARMQMIPSLMTTLNEVLILTVGFLLVLNGQLTLGMLLAAQTIASSLRKQIEQVIQFVRSLPEFSANVLRLEDVLEQPNDPVLGENTAKQSFPSERIRLSGDVELRNVSFGYAPIKNPLINNLNVLIKPGDRVAFVGGSGSGKSTIASLIAGLYQPRSGEILYDGISLVNIPRSVAIASIGMVQQDIYLYGCSVRENLTLWNNQIPDSTIMNACNDANILKTILELPEGFETKLSEGGRNLSGGQRQRLEIARALIQDPAILILDEATSALDAETERLVDEALRRRGCTQIIVAHRLSTIRDADEIIVLDHGNVVQRGTHLEMKDIEGSPYASLLTEVSEVS